MAQPAFEALAAVPPLPSQVAQPPVSAAPYVASPAAVSSPPASSYPSSVSSSSSGATDLWSRVSAAQARVVAKVPPQWVELARKQPVLWMVVTPVLLASLLVLLAVALAPEVTATARPEPLTKAAAPADANVNATDPVAPAAPAPAKPDGAAIVELERKPADSLSVEEVLLVKAHRAERKREDAQALANKLQRQPELAKESAVQVELMRLASDPDTAETALTALARTPSPVTADLLFEVWTSRSAPTATAELAGSLLSSRDVRSNASPALAVALDLRAADTCEATKGALAKAQSDGDRRALPSLGKLSARRGCGESKADDCYACLRSEMKEVTATITAVKRRRAPSYGTAPR